MYVSGKLKWKQYKPKEIDMNDRDVIPVELAQSELSSCHALAATANSQTVGKVCVVGLDKKIKLILE